MSFPGVHAKTVSIFYCCTLENADFRIDHVSSLACPEAYLSSQAMYELGSSDRDLCRIPFSLVPVALYYPHQAWETFRPRTNADLPSQPEEQPAHELIFLRQSPPSFKERRSWPTVANDSRGEGPWCREAGVGVGSDAEYGYPATHGGMPGTLAREKRETTAQDADLCAAVERSLLVPCLWSDAASLAPAAPEKASPATIEKVADQPQEEQQDNNAERSAPPATVGVEATTTTPHESGAEKQEGRVSCMIEARVRAGDWVLPNRVGVSNALGGKRENGWLRVEAVSVG